MMILCRTPGDLERAIRHVSENSLAYVLLGGGSNVLVSDRGVEAVVVRYFSDDPLIELEGDALEVSGSTILDHLARYAIEAGLEGVSHCSGIPGTVGGAVIGNAGAYGRQIGDVVESVLLMNERGETRRESGEALEFAYRRSRLQQTGQIVVSCRLKLRSGDRAALEKERRIILEERARKHPDWRREPCIGSFFRNIEPTSAAERRQAAGWYLEQAGAGSLRVGGAVVYEKHANIIVKLPGGTARDVFDLARRMEQAVRETFNMDLVREVRYLGSFDDRDGRNAVRFH